MIAFGSANRARQPNALRSETTLLFFAVRPLLPNAQAVAAAVMDRHALASTSAAVGRSAPLRETVIAAAAVA
jgi:hypothetical protein